VIDELAELLTGPKSPKAEIEEAEALLDSVAWLGRAAGVVLVAATQRPSVEVLGGSLREQLAFRFGLAVSDKGTSGLVTQGAVGGSHDRVRPRAHRGRVFVADSPPGGGWKRTN